LTKGHLKISRQIAASKFPGYRPYFPESLPILIPNL
jgi:hypothetical protein